MYILTVLNVLNRDVTIINIDNERLISINSMLEYVNKVTADDDEFNFNECVHISDLEIHVYKRNLGYVVNSKVLVSQIKIIQYDGLFSNDREEDAN